MVRTKLITLAARTAAGILAVALPVSDTLAQDSVRRASAWELRISSGAFVATGAQRDQMKNANLTAAQLSWALNPRLALNGTFSWARSRDIASSGTPKLDVFTSDIGAELRSAEWSASRRVALSAFAGIGAGARSYNYRKVDAPATHNLAGYAGIGGQLGIGRVALRLEVRDYATGFKPLLGVGESAMRNDVVIIGGLHLIRGRGAQSR